MPLPCRCWTSATAWSPYNIAHAVHVLRAVFRDFPAGTTHLIDGERLRGQRRRRGGHARLARRRARGPLLRGCRQWPAALLCDGVPAQLVRLDVLALPPWPARRCPAPSTPPAMCWRPPPCAWPRASR
ncbi:MAG: hypothetical protein WKG07_39070 [Hymenobacter sp.]